ncbi:helix-turn-helix transcriptional regulator [Phaeacidiphilus oryzae]|uniref:helix-turn-helix transcriptional regulator n=1 Tax=Phaeacidiphilus oryzae TaxID=348818 RepID=UPI000AE92F46|nr:LuxR C-terminal-related transcriptional regulator [Phaeacidiphilus oryzae]
MTGFVGRRGELADLGRLLRQARLVTVTGSGGVGKTRVALRAAAAAEGDYPDGIRLVELSGLRGGELLPHTVAAALGLAEQEGRDPLDVVLDHLRGRRLLLVLDTCEHLVDSCAMLADLVLRDAPGVTVLATSRQPLDVPGEHTFPIPPLSLDTGEAEELFAQRAAAVLPGYRPTEADREDVQRLCARLDGIPLAIELAAVRLRAVTLRQLNERLEHRFRLLTGGRRTALPRHQTLRTAIDWSYELCGHAEQLLWARLSVFAGPFDIAAAEEVCAGGRLSPEDVLATLIDLVDKSIVLRVDEPGEAGGATSYRLLDTLREFGGERLAESGEAEEVRARHLARYTRLGARFGERALDPDQLDRYRELAREHDNLRVALEFALANAERRPAATRLAADLWAYWQIAARLTEGRHWLTRVLEHFAESGPDRAWALVIRAYLATLQGEPADAVDELTEGIAIAEGCSARLPAARGQMYRQLALTLAGRHQEASEAGRAAHRLMLELDDRIGLVTLDAQEAYLCTLSGDLPGAVDRCAVGLRRLGEGGPERWMQSYLHFIAGTALYFQGEYERAGEAARTSLAMKHELGDRVGTAYCLELLGWLATTAEQGERGARLLGAADALWSAFGRRLSGTEAMEAVHQDCLRALAGLLGAERCLALREEGGRARLDAVVRFAVTRSGGGGEAVQLTRVQPQRASVDELTRREREVAAFLSEGLSNREIAERLVISKRTVDSHVEHILAKLGAASRNEIASLLRTES